MYVVVKKITNTRGDAVLVIRRFDWVSDEPQSSTEAS